jgi:hypothetical protein
LLGYVVESGTIVGLWGLLESGLSGKAALLKLWNELRRIHQSQRSVVEKLGLLVGIQETVADSHEFLEQIEVEYVY